jgi:hypothetical protein
VFPSGGSEIIRFSINFPIFPFFETFVGKKDPHIRVLAAVLGAR